jgi:hypothetical protein
MIAFSRPSASERLIPARGRRIVSVLKHDSAGGRLARNQRETHRAHHSREVPVPRPGMLKARPCGAGGVTSSIGPGWAPIETARF